MGAFILGVLASLAAALIFYLLQLIIIPEIGVRFFKTYPSVRGKWKAYHNEVSSIGSDIRDTEVEENMIIHQLGNKIWGQIESPSLINNEILTYLIKGKISETRIIYFQVKPKNKNIPDFSVGLL